MSLLFLSMGSGIWAAKIVYLGDSMSTGAFGRKLDSELRAKHDVFTYAVGGGTPSYWLEKHPVISSSIGYWVKTPEAENRATFVKAVPKLEHLIEKHHPNIIVMQTGTNLYATLRSKRRSKAENVKIIENLFTETGRAAAAGGAWVFLISPPDAHPARYPRALQQEMVDIMKRCIRPYGEVFESNQVTRYVDPFPKNDGIHYGPVEAESWARLVASAFKRFARKHSFVEERPGREVRSLRSMISPTVESSSANKKVGTLAAKPQAMSLKLRLNQKTPIRHENEIVYRNALAVYEYDILSGGGESFPGNKIRIAHMVVLNRKITPSARFKVGSTFSFDVVPLSNYPKLKSIQIVDDLPLDLESSLFICKF